MAKPYPMDLRERAACCRWAASGRSRIRRAPDLAAWVAGDPNVLLRSLARELGERGITVCHGTVGRFLRREDQSFKKNRFSG